MNIREAHHFRNVENNTAFVINLAHRLDRWVNINQNCGHIFDLRRINAIRASPGWQGCYRSHRKIVQYAKMAKLDTVLVMEDDCKIVENGGFDFSERWGSIKNWLDSNLDQWDVFLGGTTIFNFRSPSSVNMIPIHPDLGIVRMSEAFAAHFIYYNKSIFDSIITRPMTKPIDNVIADYKLTVGCPFIAIQGPSYSNITNSWDDYFNLFQISENVIKNKIE